MHFEFLRQLRERQDQTAVIPTIADILLAQFQEEQAVRLEPTFENLFLYSLLHLTLLSVRWQFYDIPPIGRQCVSQIFEDLSEILNSHGFDWRSTAVGKNTPYGGQPSVWDIPD